ncbi:hypothetical protein SteCoe_9968 [Stentor coeruleus]|uniref:Ion transport domain-containing protein n=1 Tax=Stentor coeruleus TaxID=5963 RepID=A0A1R2CGJ6_9CILI|nr:hypothetical protein SteCoe_9968 [Stentor coeruleus]
MSEPPVWSPLKVGLVSKFIMSRVKSQDRAALEAIFNPTNLHSYVLELKKAQSIMEKYCPIEITTPFKGNCLEVTSCNKYFVFGSIEGRLAVVERETKEILHDINLEGGSIYTLALFNEDHSLLAAGKDGIIRNFNFRTFKLEKSFQGHEKEVNEIIVSQDGEKIYSVSDDCTVRMWDINENEGQILFYHDKAVLCIDKSDDGTHLVTGGADKKVKVFNLDNEVVQSSLTELSSSVWSVRFSQDSEYIAAGDSNGVIKLWKFETLELFKTLNGHTKRITHLTFNTANTTLISSSNDTTLRIWDIIEDKHEIILSGHTDWVKNFRLSQDEKYIYSIAENYKIMTWNFPRFDKSCCRKANKSPIQLICSSSNNQYLYTSDINEIAVWTLHDKEYYKTLKTQWKLSAMCTNSDGLGIIAAYENNEIHFWSVEDSESQFKKKHSSHIRCIVCSPDGRYVVVGDVNFRVTVYNKRNFRVSNVFRRHNAVINSIIFGKPINGENDKLYSGGDDKVIFIYSINENKSLRLPGSHQEPISQMLVSRNNELLISGDTSGVIKIWHLLQQICMKTLNTHTAKITGIYFTENSKYFWLSSLDASVSLWNSASFTQVTNLHTKYPVSALWCTKNEADIVLGENDEVHFLENPLRTSQFFIYGPGRDYYSFMKYIMRICENGEEPHDPEMDKWMITPYEINALHFYAYLNLPGHLKAALNSDSPFYVSKSGYSPIQIALHRNFRDCINVIIKSICTKVEENPYTVNFLEESIVKLNLLGLRDLDDFYESILFRTKDRLLPKFCDENVTLPIMHFSRNLGPHQKDFFTHGQISNFGTPLAFWQSALRLDVVMGSRDSLIFLESIKDCPNTNIFRTSFVRELILYKWKYLKWVLLPQAITYFVYMICLSVYSIVFSSDCEPLLLAIFLINTILACYEVFQMILTRSSYLSDPWNYIDFTRMSLCFVYIGMHWLGFNKKYAEKVLVGLIFVTMVRGISYFRLFDKTRYMINLLRETIKDMKSFLILLSYSTYSFALIYFIMVNNVLKYSAKASTETSTETTVDQQKPFSEYIAISYLLSLGSFDTDNYGAFEWIIFFFASVINPLIMLNLLIAIMGDTYSRVAEEQEIADMQELTEMVIEGEYLLFCKRNKGTRTYMQICKEEELSAQDVTIEQKLDKLKLRVKEVETSFIQRSQEMRMEVQDTIAGINSKVDEMTGLIEQISLTQD